MKERTDELDFIKMKNFCSAKDSVKRMRRRPQTEKTLGKDMSSKRLSSKVRKGLLSLSNQKTRKLVRK